MPSPRAAWRDPDGRVLTIDGHALHRARRRGAVAAGSAHAPFDALSEQRLAAFAELVAQAIANVDARMRLKRSSARVVEAADAAR